MPLPFNKSHNGKRQYQCFVCGVLQPDWVAFKEHIFSNHEEGREYVKCPLERCSAPVRDVRMHFRAKHPADPIPNTCQMKALVWKDPKDPRKKSKKVSFKEGYHVSHKSRKKLHYNSGWELEIYQLLDEMDEIVTYEVEPVGVEYHYNGKRHTYLPDLKVHFDDGRKEIWEVKPVSQTDLAINEAKWASCAEFCAKRGWEFKVITETGIGRMKNDLRLRKKNEDACD